MALRAGGLRVYEYESVEWHFVPRALWLAEALYPSAHRSHHAVYYSSHVYRMLKVWYCASAHPAGEVSILPKIGPLSPQPQTLPLSGISHRIDPFRFGTVSPVPVMTD